MEIEGNRYLPRLIDPSVELHLRAFGAVEITGTMWSGKTWTSRAHGKSRVTFDSKQTRELAEIDVDAVLKGEAPHIIDEWQEVPQVWDAVRNKVDEAGGKRGLFILTGSSRPAKGKTRHTGSGRIARLKMWPMTLSESGHSRKSVSLAGLFEKTFEPGPVETDLEQLAELACRGGWPAAVDLDSEAARIVPAQYLDALFAKEDDKAPGSERELRLFLQSLARNVGSAATLETLAKDMGLDDGGKVSDANTRRVSTFLDYFLGRYVVCDLHGWDAPIKSRSRLRTKPKYGFADPSLPAALLGAGPDTLMGNLQLFGQLFEELCLRDLRVYASTMSQAQLDPLRYYRDADGLEVDVIIELRDGRWGAIEVKLGANKADAGVRNLLRLKNKIAANPAARNPEPSFMLVLVGKTDYQYRTPEGVIVAPITELTA
ncbi:ATP-binding protein [Raoultibacter phocaeensis]|uniref:ATP-binding protein n=1 Tax=Raoultibacter phocaeensis TaxID=2479841 RepID=UPI0015D5A339|nr:DUF4143 domain-containing protein [Raoultibacter phocaeensis]